MNNMNYTVTEQTKKYPVMFEASYTGKPIRWDELTVRNDNRYCTQTEHSRK